MKPWNAAIIGTAIMRAGTIAATAFVLAGATGRRVRRSNGTEQEHRRCGAGA